MNNGIFVIRPLQNDYTVNEIMYYERYTPNKEEFIAKVTFTADGFNNEYYTIRFIEGEDKYIVFNGWSFPRTISLQTHFRGTYESTHMNLSCISPDGLKVDVSFNENCHTIDPLHFLFTKLWITA
ncbi:MAG: hypothetical protein IKR52_03510, partial [Paludibacteraceae bacterium]|nr:hypothetical protein [Paludibacteraceae bacterium]